MKTWAYFFLFSISMAASVVFGQHEYTRIDSLNARLKIDVEDTTRISIRLQLAEEYFETDLTAAFINIEEAIRLAIQSNDKYRLGLAYKLKGRYYAKSEVFKDALENYFFAEHIFRQLNRKAELGGLLSEIGIIYGQVGSHFEALTCFNEALNIRLDAKDTVGLASVQNNLGNVYLQLEKFDRARECYLKSLEIQLWMQDEQMISRLCTNLGLLALEMDDLEGAHTYFIRSLNIEESNGRVNKLADCYTNLAVTFTRKEQFDSAEYFFDKAKIINHDLNNQYNTLHTTISLAEFFNAKGDYQESYRIAKQTYKDSKALNLLAPQSLSLYNLYIACQGLNRFEEALKFHELFVEIKDSIRHGGDEFEFKAIEEANLVEDSFQEMDQMIRQRTSEKTHFWETTWFILILFFSLLGVLVVFLETNRKNAFKLGEYDYQNVDYLRSTRILYLLSLAFFTFFPSLLPPNPQPVYDPLAIRLTISGLILLTYLLTFWSYFVRAKIELITKVFFIIMTLYTFLLVYVNHLSHEHFIEILILLTALTAVYKRQRDLLVVSAFFIAVILLIFFKVENPQMDSTVFAATTLASIFVSIVIGFSKLDLDRHLEFSNEVVQHGAALVFIINRKGENIYTSQSCNSILGFKPSELREHNWIELLGVPKETALRITNELILIAIGAIEPVYNPYQRFVSKSGEEVWLSIKEKRISNNRVLIIGLDVTEHKKIEDELSESESNFRQINETLSDVFYLFNLKTDRYEYMSPNASAIIGPPQEFFYDQRDYVGTFIVPEDRKKTRSAYKLIRQGFPFDIEYRIKIGDQLRWIREKSFPIFNDQQEVIKNSGLCQDITARKNAEQEIEKLSLVASNTDNFILMANSENLVEWANKSFYKLTGYTEEEVIGQLPLRLISGPLTSEVTIDQISESIFTQYQQMRCDLINYKKDKSLFYSRIEVTPLLDEDGELDKYFVIGSDISQQLADQEQINKLSLVASNTSNYVIIAHADEGIEWVNHAFTERFGYELDEVKGRFPSEFLHDPKDRGKSAQEINQAIFVENRKYTGEVVHVTKTGEKVFANVDITGIIGEDGQVEKYFVLGVDISERKKYEEEIKQANLDLSIKERLLSESEQNFRELIRSIKEVFYLRDTITGEFNFISDSYANVFGQSIEDLMNDPSSWNRQIHPEDRDRVIEAFNNRNLKQNFNEDFRIRLANGEEKWLNSRVFSILDEFGNEVKISGFTEDITYKKEQELQIKKIADQLDIIHAIERTILEAKSTNAIIYNTLDRTLDKLPIIRASLTLFNLADKTFYAYARMKSGILDRTDKSEFPLSAFSLYETLQATRTNYFEDLTAKEVISDTDKILIELGVKYVLMAPLISGDRLIGSLNVSFTERYDNDYDHYIQITNEVANGLAIAIEQSQLKDSLHLSNQSINASIEYAKMIQQAYIPKSIPNTSAFANHFVLNRPKDIVSGDFFWIGKFGDTEVLAVGDCTGHGVPGAFMTIIGISELNSIVNNHGIVDPARILNALNTAIVSALASSANIQLKDGMDMGILCYHKLKKEITYAGARRPLYRLRDGNLEITEATRLSIGEVGDTFGVKFRTDIIDFKEGDSFYIFSDGITDQFGGDRIRKFSRKRVEDMLKSISHLPLAVQKEKIDQLISDWQNEQFQTDDMVMVGFKID